MLAQVEQFGRARSKAIAAKAVAETLHADAVRISEQRSMPGEVLGRLRDAGLLNTLKPARFGGEQLPLKEAIAISRALACGDASTAWVHSVYLGHDYLIGHFAEEVQQDYWGSADVPLCASSLSPTGKAVAVGGGWELSGAWAFCSGIDHANWIMLGAITGVIPGGPPPIPDRRIFLLPTAACRIVDDWHVVGLRGTGSKSVVLDKVFVPADRALRDAEVSDMTAPGLALQSGKDYRYPTWALLSFALVGLAGSIARNAYDHAVNDLVAAGGKPNPLFEARRPAAQIHLAEAGAKIDSAEALFTRAFDDTFALVEAGEALTMDRRVRNRRDQCFAAQLCLEAATALLGIGGARGIREGNAVQRAFRDLLALTLHPGSNWDSTALSFGSVALGGPTTEPIV